MKYGFNSYNKPCGKQMLIRFSKTMQTAAGKLLHRFTLPPC